MKLNVRLSDYCGEPVIQKASCLGEETVSRQTAEAALPNGEVSLRAKMIDSFHFVDHPRLTVNQAGTAISAFGCDCPDYWRERCFCVHCAALALEFGAETGGGSVPAAAASLPQELAVDGSLPELIDFSYSFANSASHLYPGISAPRIPLERYKQVFGDNARARMIYQSAGTWGGSCFGMVATSTMLYQPESGVRAADFGAENRYPSQLRLDGRSEKLGMTLHAFIEAVHILQYSRPISSQRAANLQKTTCMDELCARVKAFQRGDGAPVGMAVWKSPRMDGGHSVFPYRLEALSPTEDKLYIYDPNWPLTTRFAFFEKNAQGQYLNWRFPMDDYTTYSGDAGSKLSFDTYEVYKKTWDNRGGPGVDNLLRVGPGICVSDVSGTVLARVTQDGVVTYREEIYQLPITGSGADTGEDTVILSIPAGSYVVRNEDPAQESLFLQCTGFDRSVTVRTAAREAVVLVEDESMTAYVEISEPDQKYTVAFCSTHDGSSEEVKLEGTTGAEGLCFAQHRGILFGKGISNTAGARLYINGEEVPGSRMGEQIHEITQQEQIQDTDEEYLTNLRPGEKPNDPED